jgi:hypothetical protein
MEAKFKVEFKKWLQGYEPTNAAEVSDSLYTIYNNRSIGQKEILPIVQTQIAFSRSGLNFLGEIEKVQDTHFDNGSMLDDRKLLGDQGIWDPVFSGGDVQAVLLVAAGREFWR